MVDKLKKYKVVGIILLLAIMVFISIKRIQTYNSNYIIKKEEVFIPIEGVSYVSRNFNNYVRVYLIADDSSISSVDLSVWDIKACHPDILLGKQIKYLKYTYYYGDIKYQAISTVFDSYCNENANLLKK